MMSELTVLIALYPVIWVLLFLWNPRAGLLFYFSTKLSIDLLWEQQIFHDWTILRVTGTLFPLLCLGYVLRRGFRWPRGPMAVILLGLFAFNIISGLWGYLNSQYGFYDSPASPLTLEHILDWNMRFLTLVAAFVAAPHVFHDRQDTVAIAKAVILSTLIPLGWSLAQIADIRFADLNHVSGRVYDVSIFERIRAGYHDPGGLAMAMFAGVACGLFLYISESSSLLRRIVMVYCILSSVVLYFTFTRSLWLSMAVFSFLFLVFSRRRWLAVLSLVTISLIIGLLPLTQKRFERELAFLKYPGGTLKDTVEVDKLGTGRVWLWKDALSHFEKLDPVSKMIGSGGAYGSHNQYIQWLLRNGLLGMGLYLLMTIQLVRISIQVHRSPGRRRVITSFNLAIALTIVCVTSQFLQVWDHVTFSALFWTMVGLSVGRLENLSGKIRDDRPVLIVQSRLAPFRIPLFERLAESRAVVVYYGDRSANGIAADPPVHPHAEYVRFKSIVLFGRYELHPVMPWRFLRGRYRAVVIEGKLGFITAYFLVVLSSLSKTRTILWTSGFDASQRDVVKKIKNTLLRWYLTTADAVLVYGSEAKKKLIALGLPGPNIRIAYNSIDTRTIHRLHQERFVGEYRRTFRRQRGIDDEHVVLLFVGRLEGHKKVDVLIDAFASLQRSHTELFLWIVGDGPARATLQTHVERNGIRHVHFWGPVFDTELVNACFYASDVFVLPSLGGLALQQAVANGLPCVVSEADGTEKDLVIPERNGLYFKPHDTRTLEDCLSRLIRSKDERRSMSEYSLQLSRTKINIDNMVTTFEQTIDSSASVPSEE